MVRLTCRDTPQRDSVRQARIFLLRQARNEFVGHFSNVLQVTKIHEVEQIFVRSKFASWEIVLRENICVSN